MLRLFSLPIFSGILLGVIFPFWSLSLIWVSSVLLFLLFFLNILVIDKNKILRVSRANIGHVALSQVLIFVFFPIAQTALAVLLLRDQDFVFGVAVSSLAPCALINPFFARERGGAMPLALWNVVISTLICPLITVPLLKLLGLSTFYIQAGFLGVYLLSLTTLPLLMGFGSTTIFPRLALRVQPWLPMLNSFLLAALMFILVGSSLNRLPLRLLLTPDFFALFLLFVAFDFGVFWIMRRAGTWFFPPPIAESLALSVATRNFAVSASLMLFFHPKAALPSAIGLIVHCWFFQSLLTRFEKVPQPSA